MSASEDFRPKIVRWGKKFGGVNAKWGHFIQAQQWSSGSSNSQSHNRQGGKVYRNPKLEKIGRNSQWLTKEKKP